MMIIDIWANNQHYYLSLDSENKPTELTVKESDNTEEHYKVAGTSLRVADYIMFNLGLKGHSSKAYYNISACMHKGLKKAGFDHKQTNEIMFRQQR